MHIQNRISGGSIMRKRTFIDWAVLAIVVLIAGVVIALSFTNTAKLADSLHMNPYLTAGIVELLFGGLLFIRGRQRATQKNVPLFIEIGYFASLAAVTAVNMWGLAQENIVIGCIVGLAISGAMWLMESTLVWLWIDSHKPHVRSVKDLMKEAQREIAEEKVIQRIGWMRSEARKPDLELIKDARRAEEKRKEIVGDGLPEYFRQGEPEQIVVTPIPVEEDEHEEEQGNQVIPFIRPIGFHQEEQPKKKTTTNGLFQPNLEARAKAIQVAKQLADELGRIPSKPELMEQGLTDYYSRFARSELLKG
jgi:hypothetical protein